MKLLTNFVLQLVLILITTNTFSQEVKKYNKINTYNDTTITKVGKRIVGQWWDIWTETEVKIYINDSVLIEEYRTINGVKNGLYQSFWKNSQPKEICIFKDGAKEGYSKTYHFNGTISTSGKYYHHYNPKILDLDILKDTLKIEMDDYFGDIIFIEVTVNKTIKDYEWEYFNEQGVLIKKELWRNGELIKEE